MHLLHRSIYNKIKMNELRETMISELQIMATKSRFGLFSQAPPLACGDDSPSKRKLPKKGEDGKPLTKPRNMLAGSNRSGIDRKSYVSPMTSLHAGDHYLDPEKVDLKYYQTFHTRSTIHQLEFKPSSGRKSKAQLPYKHTDENPLPKDKPLRDATGRVITRPRNVSTNPMQRVKRDLFKEPRYVSDPINRKQMFDSQERKLSKQKMPPQNFRTMSHGNLTFYSHRTSYGIDGKAENELRQRKQFVFTAPKKFGHEVSFKLARRGHGDVIGKYPQFIMPVTNLKQELVKTARKEKRQKQEWRPNGNRAISRPTPTISCSTLNLRRHM